MWRPAGLAVRQGADFMNIDMDTFLTEKHLLVQRSVRAFCEREIQPIARDIDIEARFPWEVVEKMGKLGYFGIQAPEELSGACMDSISYAIVIED